MSIRPVDSRTAPPPPNRTPAPTPSPASRFESFLQRVMDDGRVDPREAVAAAEIARLEQMRTVIDPYHRDEEIPLSLVPPSPRLTERAAVDAYAAASESPPPPPAPQTVTESQTVEPPPPPNRDGGSLDDIIRRASQTYQVDERLIRAVIRTESDYRVDAVSRAGAQGLMQLMPSTARSLGVTDPFDPVQNVMAGTRFLKELLKRYHGDLDRALAAYNWGPANVDRHGMRLPAETRRYVARVKGLAADRG